MKRIGNNLFLLLLLFSGCSRPEPLVIYTDPWIAPFIKELADHFEKDSQSQVEVVELSSEVILQHLKYGRTIDVAVLIDPTHSAPMTNKVILAGDKVVHVEVQGSLQTEKFRSQGCVMMESDGRPLRIQTEDWLRFEGTKEDRCVIPANFSGQAKEYLLRGWVSEGYIWRSYALLHTDRLKIIEEGPLLKGIYTACQTGIGHNHEAATAFLKVLDDADSRSRLAELNYFP